ncbi:uncharacterized protein TrAtP1_000971 [Trichoderma atroviride]|uniref:uncharacterized protein n=1 Tax=Hypocrea atroviridis TaxID=63577 RepID=UPI003320B050|nr:hypothetical protein TrAtP1_000971 [Trichoderma atroviride]
MVTNNGTLKKGQPPFLQGEISNGGDSIQVPCIYLPVTPGREQAHRDLDDYLKAAPPLDRHNTRSAYTAQPVRELRIGQKKTPPTMFSSDSGASYTNNNGELGAGRLSSRDPPPGWDRVARPGILLWQSSPSRVCA